MQKLIHSRWFALLDLGLAVLAGALWYLWPGLGAWPLGLLLLPWGLRLLAGELPFRRTPLDLPLALFALTALVALWASPDPAGAWGKFWLLLDGIFIYYALAGQPPANLWPVTGLLGLGGTLVATYFLLLHDWTAAPAKFEFANQIGLWWQSIRPAVTTDPEALLSPLHPNVAAGISALLLPFSLAWALHLHTRRRYLPLATALLPPTLTLIAIVLGTSRGALLALAAGLGLWFLWVLTAFLVRKIRVPRIFRTHNPTFVLFVSFVSAFLLIGILILTTYPGGPLALVNKLPGPANAGSRLDLIQANLHLMADFPFTGGGLASFPGLYSHYLQVLPFFQLAHGHNLLLDISMEQGLLAGLLFLAILTTAGLLGFRQLAQSSNRPKDSTTSPAPYSPNPYPLLIGPSLASLLTLFTHGLLDDVLYGSRGALLLFLPAGMILASWMAGWSDRPIQSTTAPNPLSPGQARLALPLSPNLLIALASAILLAILALFFRQPLSAAWQANLAALEMARMELADFPSGQWQPTGAAVPLRPLVPRFEAALALDPDQVTSQHRLGLIAMLERDYERAAGHLAIAFEQAPNHRGLRKNLGYTYAWLGQYQQAAELLAPIPEAAYEMGNYAGWWQSQGRPDLAGHAQAMAGYLQP
ncbi:MAG: tetratricopeptide repeat protein [Anaerolineales bacterium]|nr:tetratricopeptide repeat protein [Anaerolineales bacterium]